MSPSREKTAEAAVYGCRSWLYLMLNFGLGIAYFTFLLIGFGMGISLSFLLIGIPILLMVFAISYGLVAFDRWLAGLFLGMKAEPMPNDVNVSGHNPLRWTGAYLTSAATWQRIIYLLMKLPLGIASVVVAPVFFPFLMFELLLNLLGLNTGMITGQVLRAIATGLSGASGNLIATPDDPNREVRVPRQPRQRDETEYEKRKRELFYDDEGDPYEDRVHQAVPLNKAKRRLQNPDPEPYDDDPYDDPDNEGDYRYR